MISAIELNNIHKSGIYKITNEVSGKFYIGSAAKLSRRIYRHRHELKKGIHDNQHLQRAFNKYGPTAFLIECLEFCEKEKLIEREQYYVDRMNPEYNIRKECVSTNRGVLVSDKTRAMLSKANTGRIRSEETKQLLRSIFTGAKHSQETKKKMSVAQKGKIKSREHRIKIGIAHLGKKMSKEAKEKSLLTKRLLGSHAGENNPKSKLSIVDVQNIRQSSLRISDLSKKYLVSYQTIWAIKKNKTWSSVNS